MTLKPLQDSQGSLPKQLRPAWELLRQRSIAAINEGLAAFSQIAEESHATADHIFDAVGVSPRPSSLSAVAGLDAGPRFTRSDDDANPYLLYALLGLLSRAPIRSRGAELRQAIQWLNLECPAIPELQGFTGLMELRLSIHHPYGSSEEPTPYALADRIAPFPCLEKLELHTGDSYKFESLDWLPAPKLKVLHAEDVSLHSIPGLSEINTLEDVDLSSNSELCDLSPLSSSAGTLRKLDLWRTGIDGLSAISGLRELETLNLTECHGITSLASLSQLTLSEPWLGFARLANLGSLTPFPLITGERLNLSDLPRITSLVGLERSTGLRRVVIDRLPALGDASALEALKELHEFFIEDCGELQSLQWLEQLPALSEVRIWRCEQLEQLPAVWPAGLEMLRIGRSPIREIGRLPDGFGGELDLSECPRLQSLRGLESCSRLSVVRVGPRPMDFSALSSLPTTWLCIDFQNVKEDEWLISDGLVDALAALPQLRLRILNFRKPTHWKLEASDLAPLARIPHLRALDISELDVDSASFVMGLEELELLKVKPRSELSLALGGCTFDSGSELAQLKLSLLGMG